jgi:hypothetical protein
MQTLAKTVRSAVITGTVASLTSTVALVLVARLEGKAALQPLNATSHWLHGRKAADFRGVDLSRTATGYATHHAATIFWALFFARWMAVRRPDGTLPLVKDAVLMAAIAAAVDYGATPKRFTPGWELVLSKQAMAAIYLAMAAGFVAGTLLDEQLNREAG